MEVFLLQMYIILVKVGILQETPFFHDRKTHRLKKTKKTRKHVETFNKQYN